MSVKRLKSFSKISIFILLVLITVVGCAGGQKTQNDTTENGEVVIKFWTAAGEFRGEDSGGMQVIKEFNEKYKGKIRVDAKYAPWEEHNPSMQAAFSSGDTPDIFQMPLGTTVSSMVKDELIQPISGLVSEEWSERFYDDSFQEGVNVFDGEIYSWSFDGPSLSYMLYYNKDVLKNAGLDPNQPPTTWDELRDMAKVVTEQGKGDIFGLAFAGGGPAVFVQNLIAGFAIGSNPEHTMDGFNFKTGKYEFNGENWVESVNFLLDIKKDGSILPSSMMLKVPEAQMLFAEGKAAFLIDGRWAMGNIKDNNADVNYSVTHVPTKDGSTPTYGYNSALPERGIVVSKDTKHAEAVATFIEEGIGSKNFSEKWVQGAKGLSPMPEVNEDESLYPFPEFENFVQTHNDTIKAIPDPFVRNPEEIAVSNEIGGMEQSKMKPSISEIFVMLMNETGNVEDKLKEANILLNKNLQEGIEKVKGKGGNVSLEDYIFPNWDPKADYTKDNYEELK
ncbi:ABC transporter substrate-binding protein [Metabacillus niabensis]|uniref:ABC transporter substrate-binding protein n=1 Tax=Metabacillus niabensis TaxID=324854 RepID=UPI001CF97A50|nr:sugar ABC transporter substrate-binding protein [Metabacillus niabensis]